VSNGQAILVVEDDQNLTRVYTMALEAAGYQTYDAGTGQRALMEIKSRNPELVLLDLGLPDIDGLTLLPAIRANSTAPIIIVSGHGQDSEKVRALDAGADDYLTKPFSVPVLLARMRATLRNHAQVDGGTATSVSFGEYVLDLVARRLLRGKSEVHLTQTEFKLLTTLARHHDRLVATSDLLRETWGTGYQGKDVYIRVYMHALRSKLESDPAHPKNILNVAGLGYWLKTSGG
jgi:two-component system KDP operon response regulator KdpE